MTLSDGSKLGISLETIASPGHKLGPCPEHRIWAESIRGVFNREFTLISINRFWQQVTLPKNVEEVKQHLPLVRKTDKRVLWMFLYVSELTPQKVAWLTAEDWRNVEEWIKSERIQQGFREAFDCCNRQLATNVRPPAPALGLDVLVLFPEIFWPYLVKFKDGTVGITEESAEPWPSIKGMYDQWAAQEVRAQRRSWGLDG